MTYPMGSGLGLRQEHLATLIDDGVPDAIDFLEIAPENWMAHGGRKRQQLHALLQQRPFVAHGLSLSIGSSDPLDEAFVEDIARFLDKHHIALYSEHLSWCSANGHLYDLLPLPFTEQAVEHVAQRVQRVQHILGRRIALENTSFYMAAPHSSMDEASFIRAVLETADCDLHLDINNVFVNSVNFGFDPYQYLQALPTERIVYMHTAGHFREAEDLVIDTHGAEVVDEVWRLLDFSYQQFGIFPTLLERDFNIPPLAELLPEIQYIKHLQQQVTAKTAKLAP